MASPGLTDIFRRTVVLVLEHTEEGAVGVILNRPSETEVDEAVPDLAGMTDRAPSCTWAARSDRTP